METSIRGWTRIVRRRRRVVVSLVLVIVALGAATWWMGHRQDPQLVGKWLHTDSLRPSAEELHLLPDNSRPGDRREWTFESDGTGRQLSETWVSDQKQYSISAFSWWTDGEWLYVRRGPPVEGVDRVKLAINNVVRMLTGNTPGLQPDVYSYAAAAEIAGDPPEIVLTSHSVWNVPQDNVFYLTLIQRE